MLTVNQFVYLLLSLGVGVLLLGVVRLVADLRRRDEKRIAGRLSGGYGTTTTIEQQILREADANRRSFLARFLSSDERGQAIRRYLIQADVPWQPHQVITGIFLFGVGALGACLVLNYQFAAGLAVSTLVAATVAALVLPIVAIAMRRRKRLNKITEQLPEVFELLGQALRAGHALVTGIQLVGEQMPAPVGKEFARVFQEQNFGVKVEDALQNLSDRLGLLDVQMFTAAVLIQRQTGGDLAEVLDKSGDVIRERMKVAGAVRALTAEGRISGHVLTALPIFVVFVMKYINPEYVEELISGDAQNLFKFAIVWHIFGFIMIQKIVKVDY